MNTRRKRGGIMQNPELLGLAIVAGVVCVVLHSLGVL